MKNSIKVERARNNITQAKLAELTQVSWQTINAIELGKYDSSALLAFRLARIFNVAVEEIFQLNKGEMILLHFYPVHL
ncbi:helix-turn-helix transcriptional regulator [Vicingaceae bacterium]|nr:helix-turn-helix transcriptional regulator [Vicingaceae bacterium]